MTEKQDANLDQDPCKTLREVSKYGVFSGPYFPVFGLNTGIFVFSPNAGKYGPENTPYLDTFHAVRLNVRYLI